MRSSTILSSRSRSGQRGNALIESALILIVAVSMLIAIADMGQFLFLHASVVERMRAGLRYGVITYDPTAIRNVVLYGTDTPAQGDIPSFNLSSSMVTISRLDANTSEDRVMITISNYPIDFYTPFIARHATAPTMFAVQHMELGNLP
jgi:hypothetical protein